MNNIKIYIKSILIPVLIGIVVGLITSPSAEYLSLEKPPFSPPGFLFPIVWTILYVLMGISYGVLKSNHFINGNIDSIYYFQLFVNALWSILFFSLHLRLFSFIWIILLILLVIRMIIIFYQKNQLAGLLQIPYLIWLVYAAYLNYGFYLLNQ